MIAITPHSDGANNRIYFGFSSDAQGMNTHHTSLLLKTPEEAIDQATKWATVDPSARRKALADLHAGIATNFEVECDYALAYSTDRSITGDPIYILHAQSVVDPYICFEGRRQKLGDLEARLASVSLTSGQLKDITEAGGAPLIHVGMRVIEKLGMQPKL
jgi:hypothetical protein